MATDPTMMEPADDDMASLGREEPAEMSDVDDDELSEDTIEDQTDNQATVTPTDPITTPQNQQEDLPRRSARVLLYLQPQIPRIPKIDRTDRPDRGFQKQTLSCSIHRVFRTSILQGRPKL